MLLSLKFSELFLEQKLHIVDRPSEAGASPCRVCYQRGPSSFKFNLLSKDKLISDNAKTETKQKKQVQAFLRLGLLSVKKAF